MRKAIVTTLGLGLVVASFASCSSDDGTEGGGSGASAGAGGVTTGGSSGASGSGAIGGGTTCQSDAQCTGGQVCHPYSQSCVTPGGSCSAQSDCTNSTYCDSTSGSCLPGTVGSPCETDDNCGGICASSVCGCAGLTYEPEPISGPLDIYFIFDRTSSMGADCAYQQGSSPPVQSKACYATYALSDYLIGVSPQVDTRLAFQFLSIPDDICDGSAYATPLIDLMQLPVAPTAPIVQAIVNEDFAGGWGTDTEGALRGIAMYTSTHVTAGREMIGVLMTDGEPNGCNLDVSALSQIVADHLTASGIRTFIIGMDGANDANLEQLASAGGATPHPDWCGSVSAPCHYWNVGNGSGDAIANALQAIIGQASGLPCSYDVQSLEPPPGETKDFNKVNVNLTENGTVQTIGRVSDASACPTDIPAWYYDDPSAPTTINLCQNACDLAQSASQGARVSVVLGCQDTVVVPK